MVTIQGVIVSLFLIGTASAASPGSCPLDDWFRAEFSIMIDAVRSSPYEFHPPIGFDFFTDIMEYSQQQIEEVTEEAIAFFNERYGLDFSLSQPNEFGFRVLENATFAPYGTFDLGFVVNFNTWIKNGNQHSQCYPIRDGGFLVTPIPSTGLQQTLHGTYGGVDGLPLGQGEAVIWGMYNILVSPRRPPIIIEYESNTPNRIEPVDGTLIFNLDLFNQELGTGRSLGAIRITPTDDPGMFQYTYRATITFPASAANP